MTSMFNEDGTNKFRSKFQIFCCLPGCAIISLIIFVLTLRLILGDAVKSEIISERYEIGLPTKDMKVFHNDQNQWNNNLLDNLI
jgi:hypothetical protein